MIRYVLAVILAVALLAIAVPAIDHAATLNTERTLDSDLAALDEAATSLAATDELSPDGHPNPQRVVTVTLPTRSMTTTGVDHVEIVPHERGDFSTARYVLEDGTTRERTIDERIVWDDPAATEPVELGGSGERRLALTLRADPDGDAVVVASEA
ncbi:hypothetical protein RBH26_20000 [Natronolimnohabitans sp. A-GB9]|uniref:DUF7311 family protein n=1 Tax=Natronolimnohabitans sp. A-GB9 TaxID=3069757 RepID=UPI0027B74A12|nr:hypothetical protein [Natronolimnohabitans sp. A-GB9]MDQ2052730.1 hypothetical protein [Natronolimnohabitans sp. A-GB9]